MIMADQNEYLGNKEKEDGDGPVNKRRVKARKYVMDLLNEKLKLDSEQCPLITRIIDSELTRVQKTGRITYYETRFLDVFRKKPVKVSVKVLVPFQDDPMFNFVGKLLGPKGSNLKSLQEETLCKIYILGRGSMRDKQKEEELRTSGDAKYAHLNEDLHVEVSALGPPAEAHARIAYALAEIGLLQSERSKPKPTPSRMKVGDHTDHQSKPHKQTSKKRKHSNLTSDLTDVSSDTGKKLRHEAKAVQKGNNTNFKGKKFARKLNGKADGKDHKAGKGAGKFKKGIDTKFNKVGISLKVKSLGQPTSSKRNK